MPSPSPCAWPRRHPRWHPRSGGVHTLVLHPASTSHRQQSDEELAAAGIGAGTVGVSVGIEHPEDLWADVEQALAKV
ncbi:PLP-dependent transferase [Kitasatospora sp. NPDC017646]|uniref:PLP-dependent transferase n=1 Tax=Kitasatospora sp. NPDC017646 TaxID=3364024 RepID=UPI0037A1DFB9